MSKNNTQGLGSSLFRGQKFIDIQEPFNETIKPIKSKVDFMTDEDYYEQIEINECHYDDDFKIYSSPYKLEHTKIDTGNEGSTGNKSEDFYSASKYFSNLNSRRGSQMNTQTQPITTNEDISNIDFIQTLMRLKSGQSLDNSEVNPPLIRNDLGDDSKSYINDLIDICSSGKQIDNTPLNEGANLPKRLNRDDLIEISNRRKNLVTNLTSVDAHLRRKHLETLAKMEKIKQERIKKENAENLFTPQINKKSKQICERLTSGRFMTTRVNNKNKVEQIKQGELKTQTERRNSCNSLSVEKIKYNCPLKFEINNKIVLQPKNVITSGEMVNYGSKPNLREDEQPRTKVNQRMGMSINKQETANKIETNQSTSSIHSSSVHVFPVYEKSEFKMELQTNDHPLVIEESNADYNTNQNDNNDIYHKNYRSHINSNFISVEGSVEKSQIDECYQNNKLQNESKNLNEFLQNFQDENIATTIGRENPKPDIVNIASNSHSKYKLIPKASKVKSQTKYETNQEEKQNLLITSSMNTGRPMTEQLSQRNMVRSYLSNENRNPSVKTLNAHMTQFESNANLMMSQVSANKENEVITAEINLFDDPEETTTPKKNKSDRNLFKVNYFDDEDNPVSAIPETKHEVDVDELIKPNYLFQKILAMPKGNPFMKKKVSKSFIRPEVKLKKSVTDKEKTLKKSKDDPVKKNKKQTLVRSTADKSNNAPIAIIQDNKPEDLYKGKDGLGVKDSCEKATVTTLDFNQIDNNMAKKQSDCPKTSTDMINVITKDQLEIRNQHKPYNYTIQNAYVQEYLNCSNFTENKNDITDHILPETIATLAVPHFENKTKSDIPSVDKETKSQNSLNQRPQLILDTGNYPEAYYINEMLANTLKLHSMKAFYSFRGKSGK